MDFGNDADALSGSVTNIVASTEERWSGALAINGGSLDRSADPAADSTYSANLEGTITDPTQTAFDVDGRMTGNFARSDAEYVTGDVGGEACSAADCSAIAGGFLGEED